MIEKSSLQLQLLPLYLFTGRDDLLAEAVQESCQNEKAHIAILGAGGLGKTALALHILETETAKNKFGDKIYFLPCELFSDVTSLIQVLVHVLELSVTEGSSPYKILKNT